MVSTTHLFHGIVGALAAIRRSDWTMPSQRIRVFLLIAERPGITAREVREAMVREGEDPSPASTSRHILAMVGTEGNGRKVVEEPLIQQVLDLHNAKIVHLYLTARGRQVAREMIRCLHGDEEAEAFHVPTAREAMR